MLLNRIAHLEALAIARESMYNRFGVQPSHVRLSVIDYFINLCTNKVDRAITKIHCDLFRVNPEIVWTIESNTQETLDVSTEGTADSAQSN